jgi:hypothetical protein
LNAAELRKVDPAVVAEVDRLLGEHADAEIAELLNACGLRPGVAERIVRTLRLTYGLEDRCRRLRRRGLLTLEEMADLLGADPGTVKVWARGGHIHSHRYNDKGQRLYEPPVSRTVLRSTPRPRAISDVLRPCCQCLRISTTSTTSSVLLAK